jgi:Zn-dependent metalloprotease
MEEVQQHPICGFVPPYILEAIAGSSSIAEESRIACRHTLKHAQSYVDQRHELCTGAHVSPPSTRTGFIPQYVLEAIADSKEGPAQAQRAAQQTLTTAGAELAAPVQRKIYDCKETQNRPGTLARSEGQARIKDRQVNNCYDGFKITHDFFSKVFGRNSLDDKGLPLNGSVHFKLSSAPAGYNNAFWDGNKNQMVFGDGDHIVFDYLTDSLDVIAHELSHGFVQYSSPLEYFSQSGALNESCADIFGCMVEQWHMRQTADDADWILGQTLFPVAFTGSALRTLKADKAYTDDPVLGTDPQPKHMRDLYTGGADGRGVHINSGIPNHAFYLAAKSLGGNSWERAGKVWYKTMTSGKIPSNCDFATFAAVTVEIAGKEFADASVKNAIRDAWAKVGVPVATVAAKASL